MELIIKIITASSPESVVRFRGWLVGLPKVSGVTSNIKEGNGETLCFTLSSSQILEKFKEQAFEEAKRRGLEITISEKKGNNR